MSNEITPSTEVQPQQTYAERVQARIEQMRNTVPSVEDVASAQQMASEISFTESGDAVGPDGQAMPLEAAEAITILGTPERWLLSDNDKADLKSRIAQAGQGMSAPGEDKQAIDAKKQLQLDSELREVQKTQERETDRQVVAEYLKPVVDRAKKEAIEALKPLLKEATTLAVSRLRNGKDSPLYAAEKKKAVIRVQAQFRKRANDAGTEAKAKAKAEIEAAGGGAKGVSVLIAQEKARLEHIKAQRQSEQQKVKLVGAHTKVRQQSEASDVQDSARATRALKELHDKRDAEVALQQLEKLWIAARENKDQKTGVQPQFDLAVAKELAKAHNPELYKRITSPYVKESDWAELGRFWYLSTSNDASKKPGLSLQDSSAGVDGAGGSGSSAAAEVYDYTKEKGADMVGEYGVLRPNVDEDLADWEFINSGTSTSALAPPAYWGQSRAPRTRRVPTPAYAGGLLPPVFPRRPGSAERAASKEARLALLRTAKARQAGSGNKEKGILPGPVFEKNSKTGKWGVQLRPGRVVEGIRRRLPGARPTSADHRRAVYGYEAHLGARGNAYADRTDIPGVNSHPDVIGRFTYQNAREQADRTASEVQRLQNELASRIARKNPTHPYYTPLSPADEADLRARIADAQTEASNALATFNYYDSQPHL